MIPNPQKVVDYSYWSPVIKPAEFEAGGVVSAIVGLYPQVINGAKDLHPVSLRQCREIAASNLVLQAYVWDDIIEYPEGQAEWAVKMVYKYDLPVRFIWGDQEQWWTNWSLYYLWKKGLCPAALIKAKPERINEHNCRFMARLQYLWGEDCGVYTNRNFILSYTAGLMDEWLPHYPAWVPHYGYQPKAATRMTWQQYTDYWLPKPGLTKEQWLPNYDLILSKGQPAENVRGHQRTGDATIIIRGGAYNQYNIENPLDISLFDGDFINSIRAEYIPTPPKPCTMKTITGLWVLTGPGTQYRASSHIDAGVTVTVSETSGIFSHITAPVTGWVYTSGLKAI